MRLTESIRAKELLESIKSAATAGFEQAPVRFPLVAGHKLAHLVLQGGGTLGLAHLGFVYGLESAGIRFAGLAGTSAGAIVAVGLAAARGADLGRPAAELLLPILGTMPSATFMDGVHHARRVTKFAVGVDRSAAHEFVIPALNVYRRLLRTYGIHRGDRFIEWFSETLASRFGVYTQIDLQARLERVAIQLGASAERWTDLLHVAATAMPLGLRVVFPRDADWFHAKYLDSSPAIWARASMSVPLFFEPFELDLDLTGGWEKALDELKGLFPPPVINGASNLRRLHFVDGGLLSNFPIDAFSGVRGTTIPTIGVALVSGRALKPVRAEGTTKALLGYASTTFAAMKSMRDRDAIERVLASKAGAVVYVDTGAHHWLNFDLDEKAVEDLFLNGLIACEQFLTGQGPSIQASRH